MRGPIVLLKEAWAIFAKNPGTYVKIIGMNYLSIMLIGFSGLTIGVLLYFLTSNTILSIGLPLVTVLPVYVYVQAWFSIALSNALLSDSEGKHMGAKEALKASRQFTIPAFVGQMLIGAITFGGFIFFIIPGIILSIWFSMFSYILLRENKKGLRAMMASRDYLKGYTGVVFVYFIAFGLFYLAVSSLPAYIFDKMDMPALSSIYNLVSGFVLTPISILFGIGIYHELKRLQGNITEVKDYESRKYKYIAVGVVGVFVPIAIVYFAVSNLLPIFQSINWEDLYNNSNIIESTELPSEDNSFVYPEAV